jgi:hypothetical protein
MNPHISENVLELIKYRFISFFNSIKPFH